MTDQSQANTPKGHSFKKVVPSTSSCRPDLVCLHWTCPHMGEEMNTWDYVNTLRGAEDDLALALGVPTSTSIEELSTLVDGRAVSTGRGVEDTINDLITAWEDATSEAEADS